MENHTQLKLKISTLSDSMKIDFAQKAFEITQKASEAMTGSHAEMKKMQNVFKSVEKDKAALAAEGFKILTQPDLVNFPHLVEMYTEAYKDLVQLTQEVTSTFVAGFESFFEDAEDDLQAEVDQLKQVFAGVMQQVHNFREKLGLKEEQIKQALNDSTSERKYSYRSVARNTQLIGHCGKCGHPGPVHYHFPPRCPVTGAEGLEATSVIATGFGYFVSKCCQQVADGKCICGWCIKNS